MYAYACQVAERMRAQRISNRPEMSLEEFCEMCRYPQHDSASAARVREALAQWLRVAPTRIFPQDRFDSEYQLPLHTLLVEDGLEEFLLRRIPELQGLSAWHWAKCARVADIVTMLQTAGPRPADSVTTGATASHE